MSNLSQQAIATAFDASQAEAPSLEEMGRIMDVAVALRKEREKADHQLNLPDVKEHLRQRLIDAAIVAGDTVTEEEVDAAIEQYYQNLHTYDDPPKSFSRFIASMWIKRKTVGVVLGVLLTVCAVAAAAAIGVGGMLW